MPLGERTPSHAGEVTRPDPHGPESATAAQFSAPVRNHYFYGKLLDVAHLEMEQRYFIEKQRLLNRLTLGAGVLCGLAVRPSSDGTKAVVEPGVAVDSFGREILVTEPVCIDPTQLTDACGLPAGPATKGAVTICLVYTECETEPTPALVADCDVRQTCVNGAIRERYRVLVCDGLPDDLPYMDYHTLCRLTLLRRVRVLAEAESGWGKADLKKPGARPEASRRPATARGVLVHDALGPVAGDRLPGRGTDPLACSASSGGCVVLATVELPEKRGEIAVDDFTYRTTLLSNDRLFELMLCLTEVVERLVAGAPKGSIRVVSGDAQTGAPKSPLEEPVLVEVLNDAGKPVEGADVTFTVTAGNGSFEPATAPTDAKGQAAAKWTLGGSGAQAAQVSVAGAAPVDLTATAKD